MTKEAKIWDSVVVDYQLPAEKVEHDLATKYRIFLSYYNYLDFKLRFLVGVEPAPSIWVLFETENIPNNRIVFVLDNLDDMRIGEIESVFDQKPGSFEKLIQKAQQNKLKSAEKNGLRVRYASFLKPKKEEAQVSGMLFFELSETSHAILNEIVAAYSRLLLQLKDKPDTNQMVIEAIQKNKKLALDILQKSVNFSTIGRMQEIVDKYAPIAHELHQQLLAGLRTFAQ